MSRTFRTSLGVLALTLALATTAHAAPADPSRFGVLLPGLPPLDGQTNQQLADLAQTQLDPGADAANNCADATQADCLGSGFTYLGQFVDHDLTLDTSPSPTEPVDFTQFVNNRTFKFDLDQVYGDGPAASPQLYEADGVHLRVQDPNTNGVRDLPRNPDGSAITGDPRQDENQVLAQMQVAFLLAHNRLVDDGATFADARRELTLLYQRAVVDDFIPHTLGTTLSASTVPSLMATIIRTGMTPVEFSVAAYRFGHSQVRAAYEMNEDSGLIDVFSLDPAVDTLMGGRPIVANHEIEWGNFFPELAEEGDVDGGNHSRKIDTLISASLFQLPIPGAEAAGSNVLAFRNMVRAKFYSMPSGQSVAARLGVPVLTAAQLNLPESVAPAFADGVPLWYYILAESSATRNGRTLGPVGAKLVASTFSAVLMRDRESVLTGGRGFKPDPEVVGDDGVQISDILRLAGVVPEEEAG